MSGFRDRLHVEPLSVVVLNGTETDDCNRIPFLLYDLEDVLRADRVLVRSQMNGKQGRGRVVVELDVRSKGILFLTPPRSKDRELSSSKIENPSQTHAVRGKCFPFKHDLVSNRGRPIERSEEGMQVSGQRPHAGDL